MVERSHYDGVVKTLGSVWTTDSLGQALRNSSARGILPTQDAHGSENIKSIYVAVVKVGMDEHEVRGYGRYKGYYHLKPRNFRGNTCKPGENHNLEGQSVF